MAEEEVVGVKLTADTDPYVKSMQEAASSTDQTVTALQRLNETYTNVKQKTNRGLELIAASQVAAVTGLTVAAGRLEQQMGQLQAKSVYAGGGLAQYERSVRSLRTEFGLTSNQAVSMISQLNALGQSYQTIQQQAQNWTKMGRITGEDVTGSMVQLMRQTGANPNNSARYAQMVTGLSQQYGAPANNIAGFATSIAPIAQQSGMTTQQTTGISAAFAKSGQDGFAAANAFSKILSDINYAVQYGSPELSKYANLIGKTNEEFTKLGRAEAVTQILEKINAQGSAGVKTFNSLGIDGVRAQRAFSAVNQGGGLRGAINDAYGSWNDSSTFEKAYKESASGLNDELSKTRETFTSTAQVIGSAFLPAFTGVAQGFNALLAPIKGLAGLMTNMQKATPDWLEGLGAGATGAAAVGIPLAMRFGGPAVLGMMGLAGVRQGTSGVFGQSLRMAARPNAPRNAAQKNMMATAASGDTSWLHDLMMSAGMNIGSLFGGSRSPGLFPAYPAEAADNLLNNRGSINQNLGVLRANKSTNNKAMTPRMANSGFMGSMFDAMAGAYDSQMEYLHKRVGDNPTNLRQNTLGGRFGEDVRSLFGILDNKFAADPKGPLTEGKQAMTAFNKAARDSTTTLGAFGQSMLSMVGTTGRAGLGMAYGGAQIAGNAMKIGGSALGGFLMGNLPMLGVGAAMGAGSYLYGKEQDRKELGKSADDGVDNSAGSAWRNALGEAARSVSSFSDAVEQAKDEILGNSDTSSVSASKNVTDDDVSRAKNLTRKDVIDKNITGDAAKDAPYVKQAMIGASPSVIAGLKRDLFASGYNPSEVQSILGGTNTNSGRSMFTTNDRWMDRFPFLQAIYGKATKERNLTISDTMGANQELAKRMGGKNPARFGQTDLGELLMAQRDILGSTGAMDRDYTAFAGAYGLATEGKEYRRSRRQYGDAVTNAYSSHSYRSADTDEERRAALMEEVYNDLSKDKRGRRTDLFERMDKWKTETGGLYTGDPGQLVAETPNDYWSLNAEAGSRFSQINGAGFLFANGVRDSSKMVGMSANEPGNPNYQFGALMSMNQEFERTGMTTREINSSLERFKAGINDVTDPIYQLATSLQAFRNQQQDFNALRSGTDGGYNTQGRVDRKIARLEPIVELMKSGEAGPETLEQYMAGMSDLYGEFESANSKMQSYNDQWDAIDWNAQQGRKSMAFSEGVTRSNFAYQQGIQKEDYQRNVGRQQEDFDRSMAYSWEDFWRNRERQEYNYTLSRERSEENYQISRARSEYNFNLQRTRAVDNFNRQRLRSERDYNIQVERMAEQQAKSIYNIYERVSVQRTWGANNLLQNLKDQQGRIEEQNANLDRVRSMGLSDDVIDTMGLNNAQGAQQLSRLVKDLEDNSALIEEYNKTFTTRLASSTELMKDESNKQYTQMQEDRAKSLADMNEDFRRSMDESLTDYRQNNQWTEEDHQRSLTQMNQDQRRMQAESLEDMIRTSGRAMDNNARMLERSLDDFNRVNKLALDAMERGFQQQQDAYAFQLEQQKENLNHFFAETSRDFESNYNLMNDRTNGLAREQFGKLNEALNTSAAQFSLTSAEIASIVDAVLGGDAGTLAWGESFKKSIAPANNGEVKQSLLGRVGSWFGNLSNNIIGGTRDFISGIGGPGEDSGSTAVARITPTVTTTASKKDTGGPGDDEMASWIAPVSGAISAAYGKQGSWKGSVSLGAGYHSGTDFAVPVGTPVKAMGAGTVIFMGYNGAYGNQVQLSHGNGLETHYSHLSSFKTSRGANVNGGDVIALSGNTGRSFGPHLHLEVWNNGRDQNPMSYIGSAYSGNGTGGSASFMPDFSGHPSIKKWEALMEDRGFVKSGRYKPGTLAASLAKVWMAKNPNAGSGSFGYSPVTGGLKEMAMQLLEQRGWGQYWTPFDKLVQGESSWNPRATNPSSGAYGLPQSLPASKMASHGSDWRTNPETQLKWMLDYIAGRYGNPAKAYSTWMARNPHWYKSGTLSASPGYAVIGEEGPELVQLNGRERIWNAHQTHYAALTARGAQTIQTQSGVVSNTHNYDHSMTVQHMTVVADDPDKLYREMQRRQRTAALVGRKP